MNYRTNEDYWLMDNAYKASGKVSYNQVIEAEVEESVLVELFTVGQFRQQYAKIDLTVEDTLIAALITTARQMCEKYTNTLFISREVHAYINNRNGGTYLPYGPVGTIGSVADIDNNVLTTDEYKITGSLFKQIQYPLLDFIEISYTGGYGVCPEYLITAVKAQTLFLFEHRGEENVGMSPIAEMILKPHRRV